MPNGMISPEKFEQIQDNKLKIDTMYSLVYELYKRRKWDSTKIVFGGFMGGFVVMCGKAMFWK